MRKFFQKKWHGIDFKTFATLSSSSLPETEFYKTFYKLFFERYHDFIDLEQQWLDVKFQAYGLIKQELPRNKNARILSIGCGLGIIEKRMLYDKYANLEITEVSSEPLKWIEGGILKENIHIGFFPDCIPRGHSYDFILMSGIDSLFNNQEFIDFLTKARSYLAKGGKCFLISWAFEPSNFFYQTWASFKDFIEFSLEKLSIRYRGQLWGYLRCRKEFLDAMRGAGYINIAYGIMEKLTRFNTYWIKGEI